MRIRNKKYPYEKGEYTIPVLAEMLSREYNIRITASTLRKYIQAIEHKYFKDGRINRFYYGIVEEAYKTLTENRKAGRRKAPIYPYDGEEHTIPVIVSMLAKKGMDISNDTLRKKISKVEHLYKIPGKDNRYKDGIIEAAYADFVENRNKRRNKSEEQDNER